MATGKISDGERERVGEGWLLSLRDVMKMLYVAGGVWSTVWWLCWWSSWWLSSAASVAVVTRSSPGDDQRTQVTSLSAFVPLSASACLSVCVCMCLSVCICVCLSVCVRLSVSASVCLHILLVTNDLLSVPLGMCVCRFVCLSAFADNYSLRSFVH